MNVEVGQVYRDNDPRTRGERKLEIEAVGSRYAACLVLRTVCGDADTVTNVVRVRLDRLHHDGRPRKTGYSLVESKT